MWPLSTSAQFALTQSHTMDVRAFAYGTYGQLEIPVGGGQVVSDAKSQVRRTASLTTNLALWPKDPRSVLAPSAGTEIQIDYGIGLPGGTFEWIPLIRGVLSKNNRRRPYDASGSIPLDLVDRSAKVAEDRFISPVQTVSGALVVTEIRRLIQDSLGVSVPVTDLTGSTQVAPVMDIERERWADGIEKLADSIAAECFFDPQGNGIIRPTPTLADPVRWVASSGEAGTLVEREDTLAREPVYNGFVATGERTDGTAPVTAVVWDTDPTSPTYYLGPFGRKPKFYSSQLLTTVPQCTAAASAMLARARGANAKVAMTLLVNPALESGDVILLRDTDDGSVQLHLIDKVTVPLSPKDAQPLETRSLDLDDAA